MVDIFPIIKILFFAALAFIVAILWTPILSHFLYKYKLGKWVKREKAPIFTLLHKKKEGTPTMGGVLIWITIAFLAVGSWFLTKAVGPDSFLSDFNFLTRKQTLLPLGILIFAAIIGLFDDLIGVFKKSGGLKMRQRLILYTVIAAVGAWWFYFKLDWDLLHIPFLGDFNIGLWYIPIFIFIVAATAFSTNETDGLDGLAGGVLLVAFSSYAVISYSQGR